MKLLHVAGASINIFYNQKNSLLHQPWQYKYIKVSRFFISSGINVDIPSHKNQYFIIIAASLEDIVLLLIQHHANVHVLDDKNMNVLLHALVSNTNNYAYIAELLRHEIDLNIETDIENDPSNSVITIATENQHVELVKMLVEAGADINLESSNGGPIVIAASKDNVELVRYFLSIGANVNSSSASMGINSLMQAVHNNSVAIS